MSRACHGSALPSGGALVPVHGWGQILPSSGSRLSSLSAEGSPFGAEKGTPSCNAGVRDLGFSLRREQHQLVLELNICSALSDSRMSTCQKDAQLGLKHGNCNRSQSTTSPVILKHKTKKQTCRQLSGCPCRPLIVTHRLFGLGEIMLVVTIPCEGRRYSYERM